MNQTVTCVALSQRTSLAVMVTDEPVLLVNVEFTAVKPDWKFEPVMVSETEVS